METLRELYRHNHWANTRLLEVAAPLGEARLGEPAGARPRRLLGLLHHIWMAEQGWLERWMGGKPTFPDEEPGLRVSDLRERFSATAAERDAFFLAQGPAGLARPLSYVSTLGNPFTFRLDDMALHVYTHGIHHRAQALAWLKASGVSPLPELSYLFFRLEQPTLPQEPRSVELLAQGGFRVAAAAAAPAPLDASLIAPCFRFSDWATGQVHAIARDLGEAELDRVFPFGPGGTLRRTLSHLLDAEVWWLRNWRSATPGAFAELPALPVDDIVERFGETARERDAFLAGLGPGELDRPITVDAGPDIRLRVRLGESALQLPGHAMHHRAQALDMLRLLGGSPPELDALGWVEDRGGIGGSSGSAAS